MAADQSSSSISILPTHHDKYHQELHSKPPNTIYNNNNNIPNSIVVIDKTLASAANLVKLLPCGTVIAFQALSPSFTNSGNICYTSNKYLTSILISLCALSCCIFSFTDSFIDDCDGKLYYGIATFKGLYIFNDINNSCNCNDGSSGMVRRRRRENLVKYRIRVVDYIHAFFSCLVFLALALGDPNIESCLFAAGGDNTKELLLNLPLGIGFLSSIVFIIFPTSRKGIGYSDSTSHPAN